MWDLTTLVMRHAYLVPSVGPHQENISNSKRYAERFTLHKTSGTTAAGLKLLVFGLCSITIFLCFFTKLIAWIKVQCPYRFHFVKKLINSESTIIFLHYKKELHHMINIPKDWLTTIGLDEFALSLRLTHDVENCFYCFNSI